MSKKLTVREQIVVYIAKYCVQNHGNSPTPRQIQAVINRSYGSTLRHIQILVKAGILKRLNRKLILVGSTYTPPPSINLDDLADDVLNITADSVKVRTDDNVRLLYASQKGRCWWCNEPLLGVFEVDHRVPVSQDGSNDLSNLCLACPGCNSNKSGKMPWEFNGRLI